MDKEVPNGSPAHGGGTTEHEPILRVGNRLPANVYSANGVLVLRAGRVIENATQLSRILRHGARLGRKRATSSAEAEDEKPGKADDPKTKELRSRIRQANQVKSVAVRQVNSVFDRIELTGKVDVDEVAGTVSGLVDELLGDKLALASLVQLKDADSYTFTHSVNVAILAMYLAMNTQFEDDLDRIGVGAILHDIGKVRTPRGVLQKRGPLDDMERKVIQKHPQYGAELLLESGFGDSVALACVLDHHEKVTGTGYPRGKRANELSPYAKITGLADIYDALTTDRPYRSAMKPENALLLMVQKMGADLDSWLLDRFIAAVSHLTEKTMLSPEGEVVPRVCDPHDAEAAESICRLERSISGIDLYA